MVEANEDSLAVTMKIRRETRVAKEQALAEHAASPSGELTLPPPVPGTVPFSPAAAKSQVSVPSTSPAKPVDAEAAFRRARLGDDSAYSYAANALNQCEGDAGGYEFYPDASLAAAYSVSGNDVAGSDVTFSAIVTGDDLEGLECRWRLVDAAGSGGWTPWLASTDYVPSSPAPGRYTLELEVRNGAGEEAASDMEGAVFTIEPGIYLPGRFGIRLEDTGVMTEEGYVPFATSPHELVVIDCD